MSIPPTPEPPFPPLPEGPGGPAASAPDAPRPGTASASETPQPTPEASQPAAGEPGSPLPGPEAYPLLASDPPRVGDFWLEARLTARASGVVYLARVNNEPMVMLVMLSAGAAGDPAARDRLAGEVNKMHVDTVVARGGQGQDEGRLAHKYREDAADPLTPESEPVAPWVALAWDGSPDALAEADRVLRTVDLSSTPAVGEPSGPDYRLHWLDQTQPGRWRLWPPSWPGRYDRAGWATILVSWLLMILLATLALLIVVLIFQNKPAGQAQPPVSTSPQSASQSPQSGSPSSQSGSPSSQSGSPSSQSGTPSGTSSQSASPSQTSTSGSPTPSTGFASPTRTPSMAGTGSGSASATGPPVNSRL